MHRTEKIRMMNNKTLGKGMLCQETGAARPVSGCFVTYANCNGVFFGIGRHVSGSALRLLASVVE